MTFFFPQEKIKCKLVKNNNNKNFTTNNEKQSKLYKFIKPDYLS